MERLEQCPICGGELVRKLVTKVLRGGGHTATIKVEADVCIRCGERLYTMEKVEKFEEIRFLLKSGQTEELEPIGQSFLVK